MFSHPRLAAIYDRLDPPPRRDLDPYVAMAEEFGAARVLDLGCGTGILACRLAGAGRAVIAVDPAAASLALAGQRPQADRVRWIEGTAEDAAALGVDPVDLVVMTGNVAQVFVTDKDWRSTLCACRRLLRPGGRLVFETRDPVRRGWEDWDRAHSYRRLDLEDVGVVETWHDLLSVDLPLVTLRTSFVFHRDGAVLTSRSTLRFRDRPELTASLEAAGLAVQEVRDAVDRPGREFVFVARRAP